MILGRRLGPRDVDVILLELDAAVVTRRMLVRGCLSVTAVAVAWGVTRPELGAWVGLVAAALAAVAPAAIETRSIGRRAAAARADMDLAMSVFLDLVNVLLAGGVGIETAMVAAASSGDGSAFERIRIAMARAQSARRGYWDELSEWGEQCGVASVVDVAHSARLAGEHGARVRATLAAKSRALRTRNLARMEHDAERRTEQLGMPLVLMFVAFMVLIGYPAFAGTVGSL